MVKEYNVAVAGATGAVGVEMIKTLEKRNFPVRNLRLLASSRSVGKEMKFKDTAVKVEELTKDSFRGVDIALFSAGGDISKEFAQSVVDSGAVMIDNSSAFRMREDVPLVVPEVNPEDIAGHHGIIANPNCTTIIMLVAVAPLHRARGLKRLVAATYQATSGAGAKGMAELELQTRQLLNGEPIAPKAFAHRIGFNLIPHIDVFNENGYTKEELKMLNESRKMLHLPTLKVSCTCVRVPIFRAHSEALNLEFEREITPEEAREILRGAPGVKLVDDPANRCYPMPVDASEQYDVLVGRIRQDISRDDKRGLDIFVSGDQVLKGAALNAVQIAELL
ncbi:aspartate-semialdehyde dehydrogenase [Victivallis sp. Marseille-Q1083]|uniref:aspartate-semialdehyde dehydrogenase n=1 Tax=Victivallis sp. Marseille-Q1083 TaxID=2717288 RepID=UPI00158AA4C1|nr:aspartate-semialdehyde dehydrogenase [Victivallis sp. Marseille-Q1083]